MSGFELLTTLKAEPYLAHVPVIFITSHAEAGFEVSALQMGAVDFISKPFRFSAVLARVKTHLRTKQLADELRRAATIDVLTGVANRRLFEEMLEREWLRARRAGEYVSLLLVDVDHFKLFNDRYGHPKGDACLRDIALALVGVCQRPADLVARYGGEEFSVLLPQTPQSGAERMAGKVLDAVRTLSIRHEDSPTAPHVSVSVGIASYDASTYLVSPSAEHRFGDASHGPCARDLVLAADQALYSAKRAGRAQAKLQNIADNLQ
jgi:diguanylate cyclase (GGDEF)-like protein